MVCKEEVVHWFKELESYKRIDIMCTLLNMCLPFELRFFGTCLEQLGARDSQAIRGLELRVNNTNELAREIAEPEMYDPSNTRVRRKIVFYLALLRVCSRPCVNELFNIVYSWSNNDFLKRAKDNDLQELLLVYSMAANHPVFSFEQRMKCSDVYNKMMYGIAESSYGEVPVEMKQVPESCQSSSNVAGIQMGNEHIVCAQMYPIQNATPSEAPINFDQSRGSQVCENIEFSMTKNQFI